MRAPPPPGAQKKARHPGKSNGKLHLVKGDSNTDSQVKIPGNKALPHSTETERAVLGACFLKPELVGSLGLAAEDFYVYQYVEIWRAMLAVRDKGDVIDFRTVQLVLEERGKFKEIGGSATLAGLDQALPALDRTPTYARNLKKLRRRRDFVLAQIKCTQALIEGSEELEESIGEVRESLSKLGSLGLAPQRVEDVESEEVEFLWSPWLPLRKLTILEGDPGQGKSFLTGALATAGSIGDGLPGADSFDPWRTLFFSAEDGIGDTLRPRLERMEADLSHIWAHDRALDLSTSEGLGDLELAMEQIKPRLVVIDPLVAFLGAGTNTFRANEVRSILEPLAALAVAFDCSILAVRHLSKGQTGRSLYRGQGSIDFTAAARSVILAGTACDGERRGIVQIKNNLGPMAEALAYDIDENGRFYWVGASDLTAQDLLGAESTADERSAKKDAETFLREYLAGGPVAAADVIEAAKSQGVSVKTLRRAKKDVDVISTKSGMSGCWVWALNHDEDAPPDTGEPLQMML